MSCFGSVWALRVCGLEIRLRRRRRPVRVELRLPVRARVRLVADHDRADLRVREHEVRRRLAERQPRRVRQRYVARTAGIERDDDLHVPAVRVLRERVHRVGVAKAAGAPQRVDAHGAQTEIERDVERVDRVVEEAVVDEAELQRFRLRRGARADDSDDGRQQCNAEESKSGAPEPQYAPLRASTAGNVFARIEMSSQIDQFSR